MTDERMGDALFDAIARLPRRSGIVFRHYSLPRRERSLLLRRVQKAAKRREHVVTIGGQTHSRQRGAVTAPVHSVREAVAARRAGARLAFVSPVFATQSHPGAKPLGRVRLGLLIRSIQMPVIALGGVTAKRARGLSIFGIYGWAAIDGLMP
jgi:thiamine-phosphate pyrophosphorylase